MIDKLPPNGHYQSALGDVAQEHFKGVFCIDLWPVSILLLIVYRRVLRIRSTPTPTYPCGDLLYCLAFSGRFVVVRTCSTCLSTSGNSGVQPSAGVLVQTTSCLLSPQWSMKQLYIVKLAEACTKERTALSGLGRSSLHNLRHWKDNAVRYKIFAAQLYPLVTYKHGERNASLGAPRGYNVLADCMLSQIRCAPTERERKPRRISEYSTQSCALVERAPDGQIHW